VNDQSNNWVRNAPGIPVLKGVNWGGLKTLYIKEVRRFFKVQMQTVWAPAITTLLYLAIFTIALGRGGRMVMGVPFANFLAPGLIVMAMIQNAFANSSFSLLVGKIQGNIVDYLMPPLSTGELIAGLIGASVTRAFLVGGAVWLAMLLWPGVSVAVRHPELVLWFGLMGSLLLAFLGLVLVVVLTAQGISRAPSIIENSTTMRSNSKTPLRPLTSVIGGAFLRDENESGSSYLFFLAGGGSISAILRRQSASDSCGPDTKVPLTLVEYQPETTPRRKDSSVLT